MKNIILPLLLVTILTSCGKKEKYLIPKDTFTNILTDIYLADGYYMMNSGNLVNRIQSHNFYEKIIKEYGYSKANFDSTLRYYTSNPKKLEPLFDDVLTELNKEQQQIYLLQQYSDTTRNLFKKKTVWSLPKDGPREMIPFKIAIKDTGSYTILVYLKVFKDDGAKDPHLTAYFGYDDGTKNGHIDYFPSIVYKKTKRAVVLKTTKRNKDKKVSYIKGWVLNHNNSNPYFKKHVDVKAIVITKNTSFVVE